MKCMYIIDYKNNISRYLSYLSYLLKTAEEITKIRVN